MSNKGDFYKTPAWVTKCLLRCHKFDGEILEPSCGEGDISKELVANGYSVISQDLYDRGYGNTGIDFLNHNKAYQNIITNPPFSIADEFLEKALKIAKNDIALLLPTTYLNTEKRGTFLNKNPPFKIIFLKNRIDFQNKGCPDISCTYAWIIWSNKDTLSKTPFIWIGKKDLGE